MQSLRFSWTTLGVATSLVFGLSACQPQSTESSISNEANTTEQIAQKPAIKAPLKLDTAPALAVDAKTCLALNDAMQNVNNESNIEAIYAVQQTLKACLPTTSNAEVIALLKSYQAMYTRFLGNNDTLDAVFGEPFFAVMSALEQKEKVPTEDLKKLPPRLQYLVELVQNGADVSVQYLGEGNYNLTHDLQAMADIFIPYLQQDQKAYIERLAKDNQGILWNDGGIAISFVEVMERAAFWEDYIARYPHGYAYQDAKQLSETYRYLLFFGSENTQWTDDTIHEFIEPKYRPLMLKLARRPNSVLAKDAQKLLDFMSLSDSQRQDKYPAPDIDENGYEIDEWAVARYQIAEALPIASPWQVNDKNCFDGVVCVEQDMQ